MKTTIEIEDRLFARARREAARQGITLKELVNRSLQAALMPRGKPQERFALRFPVVHGDKPPAIDISDRRGLYDFLGDR